MYEIIVVGGGHAGCEAAYASAKKGHKTLLITSNLKNIADNNRIQLEIGSRTQEQYNESQQRYVIDHYANVLAFIETEDFSTALSHILAIKKVDTNYKDIVEKEIICRCEPLYREALQQMQLEKYRTAYNTFKEPVAVEEIKADAGLDIGFTMIGMHIKKVAVPVRLKNNRIGEATVLAARSRPKFIGGERAIYNQVNL